MSGNLLNCTVSIYVANGTTTLSVPCLHDYDGVTINCSIAANVAVCAPQ
jgi:hypothetical protein